MGGRKNQKNKYSGGKNSNQSQKFVAKLSQQELCDLVGQATQINMLLQQRFQKLKESKNFVYLLSTKWLKQWKQYVGYDSLFSEQNQNDKKRGKRKPGTPNTDIVSTKNTSSENEIPQELEEYQYLNVTLKEKVYIDDDFIAVHQQLWNNLNQKYGPGIEVKRPLRLSKYNRPIIDSELLKLDFIFVNYGSQNFITKCQNSKSNKGLDQLIPNSTIQVSGLWKIDQLFKFLERLSIVKFENQKITVWLCHNFVGTISIQQMIIKSIKNKSYQVYANKLQAEQQTLEDLDLQDFLKDSRYTLILEIGETKLKTSDLPDDLFGYCEECLEKRKLSYQCLCGYKFYCSKQCQVDDQVYHYSICKKAFQSEDDEEYMKMTVKWAEEKSRSGIKNLGNTCYMNSSLQTFIGFKFLVDLLTSNLYKKIVSTKQDDAQLFLNGVSRFCKQIGLKTDLGEIIQPWNLKGIINHFLAPFKGYKQHDAMDFLMAFLNTINDCLEKSQDEAYHDLIKKNLLGEYDSLVICPQCQKSTKNNQYFIQLTVPIKEKVKKSFYNYAIFDNAFSVKHGKAEVKEKWGEIRSDIGVDENCIIYTGSENQKAGQIDESVNTESFFKKFKKQILFYPYMKVTDQEYIFPANFIYFKQMSGMKMKANTWYPFPVRTYKADTFAHFYIRIIQNLNLCESSVIKQLLQKYNKVTEAEREKQSEDKMTEASSNKREDRKQGKQIKQEKLEKSETTKNIEQLNEQLTLITEELGLEILLEDLKRVKNICFFCQSKCSGCYLLPTFEKLVQDSLCLKLDEVNVLIILKDKPEFKKVQKDLAFGMDPNIQDCLSLFQQPQRLDEENAWYCHTCQNMQLAIKQIHISKFPRYLIIQLGRFKNGNNGKVKNNEPIGYRQYQVFNGQKYRLLSVIVHEGSTEGGHYWAICRRGDQFLIFNDEKVSKTEKIQNKNAYILCYVRQQQGQVKEQTPGKIEKLIDGHVPKQEQKKKWKKKQAKKEG